MSCYRNLPIRIIPSSVWWSVMEGSVSVVEFSNSKPQDQLTQDRLTDGVEQAPSAGSEEPLCIVSIKIGESVSWIIQWAMAAIVSLSRAYFKRLIVFIGIRAAWRPLIISLVHVHWVLCLICKYHNVWLQQKSVNHCLVSMFSLFYSWGWFPAAHIVTQHILF